MKQILAILTAAFICVGAAYAGCGKTETSAGKLTSYDAESKTIVVTTDDGKEAKLTMTADAKIKGKEGKEAKIDDLVGQAVSVVSEHKKVESVTAS